MKYIVHTKCTNSMQEEHILNGMSKSLKTIQNNTIRTNKTSTEIHHNKNNQPWQRWLD